MIEGRPRESLVLYDNPIEVRFYSYGAGLIFQDNKAKIFHLIYFSYQLRVFYRLLVAWTPMILSRSLSDVRK